MTNSKISVGGGGGGGGEGGLTDINKKKLLQGRGGGGGLTDIKKKSCYRRGGVSFGIHKIVKACTVLSMVQIDHTILISEGYS